MLSTLLTIWEVGRTELAACLASHTCCLNNKH